MRLSALLLALSACAAPATYRQAAMPSPAGGAVQAPLQGPGVGPAFGPEQRGEQRNLPPVRTQGPAYPAEARPVLRAAGQQDAPGTLLGLPLPQLDGTPPSARMHEKCAGQMGRWLSSIDAKRMDALNRSGGDLAAKYRCLASKLYSLCIMEHFRRKDAVRSGSGWSQAKALLDVHRHEQKHCPEGVGSPEVLLVYLAVHDVMTED